MTLVDTHAHLYLPQFNADAEAVLEAAANSGVQRILLPAVDSTTHESMLALEAKHTHCPAMMGLHPCSVNEHVEEELKVAEGWLKRRAFIAIGEIGLDFYWDKTFTHQQYDAFNRQLVWAAAYNLPVVIHSRNATDECIKVIAAHPQVQGVFHCFSGNVEQARRLIDLGWLLGIGGVATFKNGGLDGVLPFTGLEHIVLETDAPYLAPVPYRGKRNQPGYLPLIAERVAAITGESLHKVAEKTTANAAKLFKLADI